MNKPVTYSYANARDKVTDLIKCQKNNFYNKKKHIFIALPIYIHFTDENMNIKNILKKIFIIALMLLSSAQL